MERNEMNELQLRRLTDDCTTDVRYLLLETINIYIYSQSYLVGP